MRIFAACVASMMALSGCAIRPSVEDFSKNYTLDVVQSIRCEARDAYAELLLTEMSDPDYKIREEDRQKARQLASEGRIIELRNSIKDADFRALLARLDKAAIVYDFDFDIKETNDNSGYLTFSDPLTPGLFTLKIGSGTKLERQAQRNFRIADIFGEYEEEYFSRLCNKSIAQGRRTSNVAYPVTGRLGMYEIFRNYFLLVRTAGLASSEKSIGKDIKATFLEQLTFTTTLSASANPLLTLQRVSPRFNVSGFEGTISAERKDIHKLTIALYLAPQRGETNAAIPAGEIERRQLLDALEGLRGL